MSRYTRQLERTFRNFAEHVGIIPDVGTSVTVEYYTGATWTPDASSPITTPSRLYVKGLTVRFTPSAGGFFLDEGSQ